MQQKFTYKMVVQLLISPCQNWILQKIKEYGIFPTKRQDMTIDIYAWGVSMNCLY